MASTEPATDPGLLGETELLVCICRETGGSSGGERQERALVEVVRRTDVLGSQMAAFRSVYDDIAAGRMR